MGKACLEAWFCLEKVRVDTATQTIARNYRLQEKKSWLMMQLTDIDTFKVPEQVYKKQREDTIVVSLIS